MEITKHASKFFKQKQISIIYYYYSTVIKCHYLMTKSFNQWHQAILTEGLVQGLYSTQ